MLTGLLRSRSTGHYATDTGRHLPQSPCNAWRLGQSLFHTVLIRTLSQEQNIKTGRFSMIYADEVIVSHTNENEFNSFVSNKKNEALKDRMILVKGAGIQYAEQT